MASEEVVEIDAQDLVEILQKLITKKKGVEREFAKLPAPPKSTKDVFSLCRGFERAFAHTVDSVDYSAFIRQAFNGDKGLAGAITKLPLEKKFRLQTVKEVCREADGYQAHLVSPENGLRRLVCDSLELVLDPVNTCVRTIHQILLDAARTASRKAGNFMEGAIGLDDEREALRLPGFENAVVTAVTQALERWRTEALEVTARLVEMEQTYVTAAFFRHKTMQRYQEMSIASEGERALVEGGGRPAPAAADDSDSEDEEDVNSSDTGDSEKPGKPDLSKMSAPPNQGPLSGGATIPKDDGFGDIKTGFLEKRIGDKSGRQNLPESWKWQKRYFVLTEPKGMLYYFKSADDPPNYRGLVDLRVCKVEDLDVNGMPKTKQSEAQTGAGGAVSLLIRIAHKDPMKPCVKGHHSLVLRAETAAEKYSWLARLRYASDGSSKNQPIKKYESKDILAQKSDGSKTDGKEQSRRGTKEEAPSRVYMQSSAPNPTQPAHIPQGGLASSVLFGEGAGLGPEPTAYATGAPIRPENKQAYDDFYQQLGQDTLAYVRTVCQTILLTVPKAIVHCQVKRATQHLLEQLFSHVSNMSQLETDSLLGEDTELMQRRAAARQAVLDIEAAAAEVKGILDERAEAASPRTPSVRVSATVLQYAGIKKHSSKLSSHQRTKSGRMFGDYTPKFMQAAAANGDGPEEPASLSRPSSRPSSAGRRTAAPPPRVNPQPAPQPVMQQREILREAPPPQAQPIYNQGPPQGRPIYDQGPPQGQPVYNQGPPAYNQAPPPQFNREPPPFQQGPPQQFVREPPPFQQGPPVMQQQQAYERLPPMGGMPGPQLSAPSMSGARRRPPPPPPQ